MTHKEFFDLQVRDGLTTVHRETMLRLHTAGLNALIKLGCSYIFEIGSGLGYFLKAAQSDDCVVLACGYDPNTHARDWAISELGVDGMAYFPEIDDYELGAALSLPHAIYCVEVFEHLTDDEIRSYLSKCEAGYFYFTSTPYTSERDAEIGHINIKQENQWIALFAEYGYKLLRHDSAVTEWGMIFQKER